MSSHARHSPTQQNVLFRTFATDRRLTVVAAPNGGSRAPHPGPAVTVGDVSRGTAMCRLEPPRSGSRCRGEHGGDAHWIDALAFAAGRARGALEVPDFLAGDRDARREALAAVLKDLVRAGRSRFSMSTRSFPRPRRAPGALRQTRGFSNPLICSIILLQLVFFGAV